MKRKFLLLILFAAVLATGSFAAHKALAQSAPREILITAKRSTYSPDEITLKKGQPVVLVLKSQDVAHGLRIRDFNIKIRVKAGGTAKVKFTPENNGDFVGQCFVFCGSGHGSMTLKVHVVA